MAIKKKYSALGRGLDALISTEKVNTAGSGSINEIPIGVEYPKQQIVGIVRLVG